MGFRGGTECAEFVVFAAGSSCRQGNIRVGVLAWSFIFL